MAAHGNIISGLLYPQDAVCIACGALRVDTPGYGLCRKCAEALVPLEGPFCPRCGKQGWDMVCPECQIGQPDALDGRVAAFAYGETARGLVRALKYGSVITASKALAEGMGTVMPEGPFDVMVPVPLHKKRARQRGFNQAEVLCEALSQRNAPPILHALLRDRATRTQTRLDKKKRSENVKGAFVINPDTSVTGLSILLVDDVLTTGATAVACAEALKAHGASKVVLIAAASAQVDMEV